MSIIFWVCWFGFVLLLAVSFAWRWYQAWKHEDRTPW